MPNFYKGKSMKVRKYTKEGSLEVTVPKILSDNEVIREGDKLTPIFDSILVYLPEGKSVDPKKLSEAIIEAAEDAQKCR